MSVDLDRGLSPDVINWEGYSVQDWINKFSSSGAALLKIARVVTSERNIPTLEAYKRDLPDEQKKLADQLFADLSSLSDGARKNLGLAVFLWDDSPDYS